MKLTLEVNPKAIRDDSRKLAEVGLLVTPAINEDFWLYRVAVSPKQAVVGFPKFNVIGIGFQHEIDWNTNLPSGCSAAKIYDHIKHNSLRAPKDRCVCAIQLIKDAVLESDRLTAIDRLKASYSDDAKLNVLGDFLRRTGSHTVASAMGR